MKAGQEEQESFDEVTNPTDKTLQGSALYETQVEPIQQHHFVRLSKDQYNVQEGGHMTDSGCARKFLDWEYE